MPDHDQQLRVPVEHSAEDHANEMNRGFDVPAPTGCREDPTHRRGKAAIQRVNDRLRRYRRMQIDRDIQRFGALQDRPEELIVQIAATRVPIDERAFEALLPDPAIQFIGRLLVSRDRQGGKSCKARRIFLHHIREEIVRLLGDDDLFRHIRMLDPRGIQREHLHIDTGGVHLGNAPVTDIPKLLENHLTAGAPTAALFNETSAWPGNKSGAHEVFFEGDGPQFCFLRHMSPMALRSPCATVNIGSAETTPTRHRSRHTRAAPSARYISLTTRTRVIASVSSPPRTRGSHARTVQPVPWHRPAAEEVCVTAQFLPKNLGSECKSRYRGALDALA